MSIAIPAASVFADEWPTRSPDFSGKFRIKFHKIMCQRPPCPGGTYGIYAGNETVGTVKRVVLRETAEKLFEDREIGDDADGLAIDGDLWIRDGSAYVAARRAVPGAWKP